MHDGMPNGRNQGQGHGHSREVDRQSPTGLIFHIIIYSHYPIIAVIIKYDETEFLVSIAYRLQVSQ